MHFRSPFTHRRFTRELAVSANNVIAVDFMEKFIEKNRELNGKYSNIDFRCADVTKLNLDVNRYLFPGHSLQLSYYVSL